MKINFCKIIAEKDKRRAPLNKPFRLPKGDRKKFGVYVKNDKGNVVLVKFGDPNMEIKRDNPERKKAFRARHNCDNPGPKWKSRWWSCRLWSQKKVSDIVSSAGTIQLDWDGVTLWNQDELVKEFPYLIGVEIIEENL